MKKCSDCNKRKRIHARGQCRPCYDKARRQAPPAPVDPAAGWLQLVERWADVYAGARSQKVGWRDDGINDW